jgi:hypothetical protein
MYTETAKLHLIEDLLKINDVGSLAELKKILDQMITPSRPRVSAKKFAGRWSNIDATQIEKAIEDGCGQINEDDWK